MALAFKLICSDEISPLGQSGSVINLCKEFLLTPAQHSLLNKGLTFSPSTTTTPQTKEQTKLDLEKYHRALKLAEFFKNQEDTAHNTTRPFQPPSFWEPPTHQLDPELLKLIEQDKLLMTAYTLEKEQPNLTHAERKALKELKSNQNIVIKPADKGSNIVLMDQEDYIQEAQRQLADTNYYKPLQEPLYGDTTVKIRQILQRMVKNRTITPRQRQYLQGPNPPRPRIFYLLPKIHKEPETWTVPHRIPPGRPIVSDCSSESYGTAQFIDHFLGPLSTKHNSYVKNTIHFLEKVAAETVSDNSFLFTMDVESLYTNIETDMGLEAIRNCFKNNPDPNRPDQDLLEILQINLERNDFQFDEKWFLQIKGTAMGKRFSPSYANIYMAQWEREALATCPLQPQIFLRYLDDIWGIWNHSKEDFDHFVTILNNHHPSIKLKPTLHSSSVDFLDVTTFKGIRFRETGHLDTKLYRKPTDTITLLHFDSFHPKHVFKGLLKSQILRINRICSSKDDTDAEINNLCNALKKRNYPRTLLRRAKHTTHTTATTHTTQRVVPCITTYSTTNKKLQLQLKHNLERMKPRIPALRHLRSITAYRRKPNLRDLLVRSRLTNAQLQEGNTSQRNIIRSSSTPRRFTISAPQDAKTANLIYKIQCGKCGKQYIGETKNSLATRLYAHKYNIRHNKKPHTTLVKHFRKHHWTHLQTQILEHNPHWTTEERRKKEKEWIQRLQTQAPQGLNDKEHQSYNNPGKS